MSENSAPSPARRERELYRGPRIEAVEHPLGLKWNWEQIAQLGPELGQVAGGATFFELVWCEVEPESGRHNWSEVDDVARSSQRLGYRLLLKLRVGTCWATGNDTPSGRGKMVSRMPADLRAYEDFISEAVARYAAHGVHGFAIENEVNARNSWAGSPDDYDRLARAGAAAVRGADPDATVLDSGISSISYGVAVAARLLQEGRPDEAVAFYRNHYVRRFESESFVYPDVESVDDLRAVLDGTAAGNALAYLDLTAELTAAGIFDVWQLHYYEQWDDVPTVLDHLTRLAVDVPIEAWEVGVAWPGDDYDEAAHAGEVVKLLSLLLAAGVRPAIYLPAAYTPGGLRPEELWRGLWLPDGTPRAAAQAYAEIVKFAAGSDDDIRQVRVEGATGVAYGADRVRLVIWNGDPTRPLQLAGSPPADVRARTITGEPVAWDAGGLRIGPDPVVIDAGSRLDDVLELVG